MRGIANTREAFRRQMEGLHQRQLTPERIAEMVRAWPEKLPPQPKRKPVQPKLRTLLRVQTDDKGTIYAALGKRRFRL